MSIGEISFSLLQRLDAWGWGRGSRAIAVRLPCAISGSNQLGKLSILATKWRYLAVPGREAATPTVVMESWGALKHPQQQQVRAEPGRYNVFWSVPLHGLETSTLSVA